MRVRHSARAILINQNRDILMLHYVDATPVDPHKPDILSYWVLPGGGVKDGETFEEAVMREIEEETGLELDELGPWIWTRERELYFKGELMLYYERYFLAYVTVDHDLKNRTKEAIVAFRWWSIDEMQASDVTFLPPRLPELVRPLLEGHVPQTPIRLSDDLGKA